MIKQKLISKRRFFILLIFVLFLGTGCGKTAIKNDEDKSERTSSSAITQKKVKVETNKATVYVEKGSTQSSDNE